MRGHSASIAVDHDVKHLRAPSDLLLMTVDRVGCLTLLHLVGLVLVLSLLLKTIELVVLE